MDCGILDLPEGTTCSFFGLQRVEVGKESSQKKLKHLLEDARVRFSGKVESILLANHDRIDEIRDRSNEIRDMLKSCDEKCLIGYFSRYFDKRMKIQKAGDVPIQDLLETEIQRYLGTHPKVEEEVRKWYETYNHGNYSKSSLLKLLPPILESIEKRAGVVFGFIPIRGGFISLMRNQDGTYYALKGDILSQGASIEKALSPFVHETTILQIVDKQGRAIGDLETPLSRTLDALLFIDRERSVWSQLTQDMGKAVDIRYHQDGHQIRLFTPKEGLQFGFSQGQENISSVGKVIGNHVSVGYHLRTSFSESTLSLGSGTLQGENFFIHGVQGGIRNHVHFGEIPMKEESIGVHGLGKWDLKIQGPIKKPDTAKLDGSQALALTWNNYYLGYGRNIRWSPDLIEKEYTRFTKEPLFIGGVKQGNRFVDMSFGGGIARINLSEHTNSSAFQAMVEYRRRTHLLVSKPEIRAEASFVKQF